MNNAIYSFEKPQNEPIKSYGKGTIERAEVEKELKKQSGEKIEIPIIIGGKEIRTGNMGKVVMPHNHKHVLADYHKVGVKEVEMAIDAALKAKKEWEEMPFIDRGSIMLRIAEKISKEYSARVNVATMLGQSKNVFQAEIDSTCELVDFLRYNTMYASQIYSNHPKSDASQLNRIEYRPLEGFVMTVSPFNFTAIASNLNMAAVMMGNTTIWKPATTSLLSNYHLMQIFKEAGLPDGVINFIPGQGSLIGGAALASKHFAGVHFTGSSATFNNLWQQVGNNLNSYVSYPKLVGETGGKDFIFVHNSANTLQVATAIVRGAFEYQGQKCSAASRAYVPKSMWTEVSKYIKEMTDEIKMGDVSDFHNFVNAVIDEPAFDSIMAYVNRAKASSECKILTGGNGNKKVGYFIEPTVIETTNPFYETMQEELFGPVITVFVYDDTKYEDTLAICDQTSPYALTGSIMSNDRKATLLASNMLRYAAGNFYINDKCTGAVVGMQPFGGSRASGTNDKAGGYMNLIRWTNPRSIKETYVPASDYTYPFMK